MKPSSLLAAAALFASSVFASPTPTRPQRRHSNDPPSGFVYSRNGEFLKDGKTFYFFGTTAYWLPKLNSLDDIDATLKDIHDNNINVVRVWGFDECTEEGIPFCTSLWKDGKRTFLQDGVHRLKYILEAADKLGMKIQFALTNNWSPTFKNPDRPHGYFSNSYGGIDTYVRQIRGDDGTHDEFYVNTTIKQAYKDWLKFIVPQFKDCDALLAWELANDPRCEGADGTTTSSSCNSKTITRWTNEMSAYLKTLDPNHMTASGDGGWYCVDCEKLNPLPATASGGSIANLVGRKRNNGLKRTRRGWLTGAHVDAQIKAARKDASLAARLKGGYNKRIRGAWSAPAAVTSYELLSKRQQDSSRGTAYNGYHGVDTEDISNSPSVDFTTFHFFPDQNTYTTNGQETSGPPDGGVGDDFEGTVQNGIDWITNHAESAQVVGKPSTLNGFGLVSQDDSSHYTPFYSTVTGLDNQDTSGPTSKRDLPLAARQQGTSHNKKQKVATSEQQGRAYKRLSDQSIKAGVNGVTHYQWGKKGNKSQKNSVVDDSNHSGNNGRESQGSSPNDGYSSTNSAIQSILSSSASKQRSKSGQDSS